MGLDDSQLFFCHNHFVYKTFIWSNQAFFCRYRYNLGFAAKSPLQGKYRVVWRAVNGSDGMLAVYSCCDGDCILCDWSSREKGVSGGFTLIFGDFILGKCPSVLSIRQVYFLTYRTNIHTSTNIKYPNYQSSVNMQKCT